MPGPVLPAVMPPRGLISVRDAQGADFIKQVRVEGLSSPHGLALEALGTGGHKLQAEEVREELADLGDHFFTPFTLLNHNPVLPVLFISFASLSCFASSLNSSS